MKQEIKKIDWNNLYKLRIANPDGSMLKHEVTKLLILIKLLRKYKKERRYIRIYTEQVLTNSLNQTKKCDVYFENTESKEAYAFEIQKDLNPDWEKETLKFYKDFNQYFFDTSDLIIIPLDKLSSDILTMDKQLEEYLI